MPSESAQDADAEEKEVVILQWEMTTLQDIRSMMEKTAKEVKLELKEILGFRHCHTCMKEAALLDYYLFGFWWAKEANFTPAQISFTMAALHMLLENTREKQMGFVDNLMEFAKALAAACQSKARATPLLRRDEATELITYIKDCYFQKYRLYELLFTATIEESRASLERAIEVISEEVFVPLEEGIPMSTYLEAESTAAVEETPEEEEVTDDAANHEQP